MDPAKDVFILILEDLKALTAGDQVVGMSRAQARACASTIAPLPAMVPSLGVNRRYPVLLATPSSKSSWKRIPSTALLTVMLTTDDETDYLYADA